MILKKAILMILSLVVACSGFAFTQGTKYLGGTASVSRSKADSDATVLTIITQMPEMGLFVTDDNSLELIFKYAYQGKVNVSLSAVAMGVGFSHYFGKFYTGTDFQLQSSNLRGGGFSGSNTGIFLSPKLGYLLPVTDNAYLDLGANYLVGIGDYSGGGGENEVRSLRLQFGLQYFFVK